MKKRAAVEGLELEYELRGSGEPVVLIHWGVGAAWAEPLVTSPRSPTTTGCSGTTAPASPAAGSSTSPTRRICNTCRILMAWPKAWPPSTLGTQFQLPPESLGATAAAGPQRSGNAVVDVVSISCPHHQAVRRLRTARREPGASRPTAWRQPDRARGPPARLPVHARRARGADLQRHASGQAADLRAA